jgi:hypothetical protein
MPPMINTKASSRKRRKRIGNFNMPIRIPMNFKYLSRTAPTSTPCDKAVGVRPRTRSTFLIEALRDLLAKYGF